MVACTITDFVLSMFMWSFLVYFVVFIDAANL